MRVGNMCRDCEYLSAGTHLCTFEGVGHGGEKRKATDSACPMFAPTDLVISPGTGNYIVISRETMAGMEENTRKMGDMILQLGTMIGTMQKRMDEMEARQAAVTISHGDVKRIQGMIRARADELCRKYQLTDKESAKRLRAAIKKDVLQRWGVKDLHDLKAAALPAVEGAVPGWVNIRLVMERRAACGQ